MRIRLRPLFVLIFAALPLAALAQNQPASTVRTLLAAGRLASVVELPLYFRLYRIHLPAAQHAAHKGESVMLYDLSGTPAMAIEGGAARPLADGDGAFVAGGQEVTISAAASEPAELLAF